VAAGNIHAVPAGRNYVLTTTLPNAPKCLINVSVQDMKMYICRAHVTSSYVPRSISQTIFLKQFYPFITQLPNSSNTITAPMEPTRRVTHIAVCFIAGTPANNFHYSPTDFSSGFTSLIGPFAQGAATELKNTGDMQSQIQQVSVTYGGITYPQAVYNLTNNNSNTNDLFKAFSDYTIFSDSIRDRSGSLLDYNKWQVQQIYIFKMRQGLNNANGNCYITINGTGAPTVNTSFMVLGLYDEYLTITYDNFARITEIKKEASPPLSA